LIVDDELGVRESLRAILQGDCEVRTAASGDEALAIVGREPVDLMTLDLKMPGAGGMRVLERVKQIDPDIEVLIITGYGSLDTAIEGLRFQAMDYLAKPFDCEQVRLLVQKAWARRLEARRVKSVPEQVLSTLSHEFRTPLNAIVGYSSMLQEDADNLSREQRLALERIQANSASFLGYVEALIYLSELSSGLHPVVAGPVAVADLLGRLACELSPAAQGGALTLRLVAAPDLLVVTDEDKLLRLLRALADNAVRFTPAGGEVTLEGSAAPDGARLAVRDTGPGLAAELIAETVDEASGASRSRPAGRIGFGLRLAARLARVLGVSLDITAAPAGTTCRLVVPNLETARAERATA
jgi:signal transduction histidine kinase